MRNSFQPLKAFLAAVALLGTVGQLHAADTKASQTKADAKASATSELQKAREQFDAQSARLVADYQAQLEKLKNATEEERKAIRADLIKAQTEMLKRMKDERRKLLQNSGK